MDKPTHSPATPAPTNIPTPDPNPSDNYATSGPPPEYQQHQHQHAHLNAQPTGTSMPKYGGPSPHSPPPPQNYGGYVPPQSYPLQTGGPQNFQPYGTPLPSLGPHPAPVECPECHARGVTAVEYSSGGFTHALAALVCFVSCLGCIPYLFSSLKDARHKCSKCGIPLATYHRSGRTEVHWHQAYNA